MAGGGEFAADAEGVGAAHLLEVVDVLVGGAAGRDDGVLGEVGLAAVADGGVPLGEGGGAAVEGLGASAWGGRYSGLFCEKRRLLLKECVILAGEVLARCFRMF